MDDHRTLDEFARGQSEDDPDAADGAIDAADERAETTTDGADSEIEESELSDAAAPNPDAGPVDPPATTYRWRPEGVACADCDAVVERQWRDGGEFVCVDCKDW